MNTTISGNGQAIFSNDAVYRYFLSRRFNDDEIAARTCIFIMLNPSTADAFKNDPTITRCSNYAKAWGYNGLVVLNLFALRSTTPKALKPHIDPVGPGNDAFIRDVLSSRYADGSKPFLVCAWGAQGGLHGRSDEVYDMIMKYHGEPHYLALTKGGEPYHPLDLEKGLTPTLWV